MDEQNTRRLELAQAALDRSNPTEALSQLDHVTSFDEPRAFVLRCWSLEKLEDYDAAIGAARAGLSLFPEHRTLLLALSSAQSEAGHYEQAEQSLLAVLNQNPDDQEALVTYALLLCQASDPVASDEILDRLAPEMQENSGIVALRSINALGKGRNAAGLKLIKQAVRSDPDSAEMHAIKGVHQSTSSRTKAAGDSFVRAAELDPEAMGDVGREGKLARHPLLWPSRVIDRIGATKLWISMMVVVYGGRAIGPDGRWWYWIVLPYVGLVVYSWTVPFLLRKWYERSGRL